MNDPVLGDLDVDEDAAAPEEVVDIEKLQNGRFFEKIKFAWRQEDSEVLHKIHGAAKEVTDAMFTDARLEVAVFWGLLKDQNGKDDWSRLDVAEVEQVLMNLQQIKFNMGPEVNKLKSEAGYARMVSGDIQDHSWGSVIQATTGDKQAKANRDSQQDRYHAYFRYCIWSQAQAFYDEIRDFIYRLRDLRDWHKTSHSR